MPELNEPEEAIEFLDNQVKKLKNVISELEDEVDKLKEEIRDLENDNDEIRDEKEEIQDELDALKNEKDREGKRKYSKEYYTANKEKILEKTALWHKNNTHKSKISSQKSQEKHRELYPEKERFNKIKYKYNLTEQEYKNKLLEQNNECLLCKISLINLNTKNIHVDHIHGTKVIRGILCSFCNKGLGHFKDNIETLKRAISYIELYEKKR